MPRKVLLGDQMKEQRWGKKKRYDRDWTGYNEELVVRGIFYLDFGYVKHWTKELEKMNLGKKGHPFEYPESFMRHMAVWHQLVDYRGLEGIARSFVDIGVIPSASDYTAIWHRIHDFVPEIQIPSRRDFEVASDGSGMKENNAGSYRESKYGRRTRKKYLVVTITADPKRKKLLGIDVHVEGDGPSEPEVSREHMKNLKQKGKVIKKFYGDGKFDQNAQFEFLQRNKIKSAVKIRKNAKPPPKGNKRRKVEVKKYKKLGYKKWAKEVKYGMRWPGTEGIFSAVKRKFTENVVSHLTENMIAETVQRFWVYDTMKEYASLR